MFHIFFTAAKLTIVCKTVSGATPNLPCIFPFHYNCVTHTKCTWDHAQLTDHKPWCSTLVDDSGNHVEGQGKWGNCGTDCSIPPDDRATYSDPCNTTNRPVGNTLIYYFTKYLEY